MIGTITNTVVALMIVTTGFEKVVGSMEMEFIPCPCQSSNSYGLVAGVYRPKEPYVDLYRKVCTTNFVYKSEYSPFSFEDIVVDEGKYPVIQAIKTNVWHSPSPVYLDSKCGGKCKEGDKK